MPGDVCFHDKYMNGSNSGVFKSIVSSTKNSGTTSVSVLCRVCHVSPPHVSLFGLFSVLF